MTPEQRANGIDLGNDYCCLRATGGICYEHQAVADAIRAAVAEEREACAREAESWEHRDMDSDQTMEEIAKAIRKRGKT
jgi:hypothetical protein